MTCDELRAAYWRAMDAAHLVDVVTAEAKMSIARIQCTSALAAEEFNVELARYLIQNKAPNGYHVDLFGDGMIKQRDKCRLDPPHRLIGETEP